MNEKTENQVEESYLKGVEKPSKAVEDALAFVKGGKKLDGVPARGERIIVYGRPGIGKSTFAASADRAFIIDIEDSTDFINKEGSFRTPRPENWDEVIKAANGARVLKKMGEFNYDTIVIDTVDRMVDLMQDKLIRDHSAENVHGLKKIKELQYGGEALEYIKMFNRLMKILSKLECRIILVCHTQDRKKSSATEDDHLMATLKLTPSLSEHIVSWVDFVLFATQQTYVDGEGKRSVRDDSNIIKTANGGSSEGKRRVELPQTIKLNWNLFKKELNDARNRQATNPKKTSEPTGARPGAKAGGEPEGKGDKG